MSSLKFPLEIGKRYRVIYHGEDNGVHECIPVNKMPDADEDEDEDECDCLVGNWYCRTSDGAVAFVESQVRLEGPIE